MCYIIKAFALADRKLCFGEMLNHRELPETQINLIWPEIELRKLINTWDFYLRQNLCDNWVLPSSADDQLQLSVSPPRPKAQASAQRGALLGRLQPPVTPSTVEKMKTRFDFICLIPSQGYSNSKNTRNQEWWHACTSVVPPFRGWGRRINCLF